MMYRQSSWESGFSSVLSGGFSGFLTVCPFSQSFGIRIVCFWISCIWFLSMSLRSGVRLLATQNKGKSRRRKSRHSGGRDWESRAVCLEDCFRSAAPTAGCAPGFGELDSGDCICWILYLPVSDCLWSQPCANGESQDWEMPLLRTLPHLWSVYFVS